MMNDLEGWLASIVAGKETLSQRGVRWVEAQGDLEAVVTAAKERGVHVVQLTDDQGKGLITASPHAFRTLC